MKPEFFLYHSQHGLSQGLSYETAQAALTRAQIEIELEIQNGDYFPEDAPYAFVGVLMGRIYTDVDEETPVSKEWSPKWQLFREDLEKTQVLLKELVKMPGLHPRAFRQVLEIIGTLPQIRDSL